MGGLWVSWLILLAEFPGGFLGFVIVDGADLVFLRFAAFTGFGDVVLLAAFDTRGPVGKALNGSSFAIGSLVGWSWFGMSRTRQSRGRRRTRRNPVDQGLVGLVFSNLLFLFSPWQNFLRMVYIFL